MAAIHRAKDPNPANRSEKGDKHREMQQEGMTVLFVVDGRVVGRREKKPGSLPQSPGEEYGGGSFWGPCERPP